MYKSDDRSKCENSRPISILPVVSKIFEKEIFKQLYDYLSENSLLSNFNLDLDPNTQLYLYLSKCVTNGLKIWIMHGKITGLISLDINKAFDSIDHEI